MQIQTTPTKKLSRNSQFFTVVFEKGSRGAYQGFYSNVCKLETNPKIKIIPEQFYQLIVQTTYLVFTAGREKLQLKVNLEDDLMFDSRDEKKAQSPFTFYLRYEINQESTAPQPAKQLTISLLDGLLGLKKKFPYLAQLSLFNQFSDQFKILKGLNLNSDKEFFLGLEETELFRRFAFLLKLKNCMIMNLIKMESGLIHKFWEAQKKQVQQVNKYKEAKENKQNEKELECSRNINDIIGEFLTSSSGIANKVLRVEKNEKESKELSISLCLAQKKLGFAAFAKKYGKDSIQPETDFKRSQSEYVLEYNQQKNLVSLWLVTDIAMVIEFNDFLLNQCNKLTFDCTEVNVDHYEKTSESGQKSKFLALKCDQLMTSKQAVLQTILLMMDRTMIIYRIIHPYLNRVMARDIQMPDQVYNKITHYLRIFKCCSKAVYSPPV